MTRPNKPPRKESLLKDPRQEPDFQPEYFPSPTDGPPPAPRPRDRRSRQRIAFLSIYYRLNHLLAQLDRLPANSPERQPLLDAVRTATRVRDELEDESVSTGFIGEPVIDGAFYRQVRFTQPPPSWRDGIPRRSSFSSCIEIPLPRKVRSIR